MYFICIVDSGLNFVLCLSQCPDDIINFFLAKGGEFVKSLEVAGTCLSLRDATVVHGCVAGTQSLGSLVSADLYLRIKTQAVLKVGVGCVLFFASDSAL